ncbi:MAG: hypothetical protein M1272_07870 [Firmicutes bacterium]|nr:hypothetical protein [Bacillota bacterium]
MDEFDVELVATATVRTKVRMRAISGVQAEALAAKIEPGNHLWVYDGLQDGTVEVVSSTKVD